MIKIKLLKLKLSKNGFSLIELMMVVVILSIITLGLVSLFSGSLRSWISGDSQLMAQRNARQAMDRMVRELRLSEIVKISTPYNIEVTIPDLGVPGSGYDVSYSWSGTAHDPLNRIVTSGGGGTNIVIDDVLNLKFSYLKTSRVNILLEIDRDNDDSADISLITAVNFRNF